MNLERLGILDTWIRHMPLKETYPLGLSPNAQHLWVIALGYVKSKQPKTAWMQAVEQLIRLAEDKNIYAFKDQQSDNDKILMDLISLRRQVVKFIDRNAILQHLRTRTSKRSATVTPTGFVLDIDITCATITEDPTFVETLGLRRANGRRERLLDKGLLFYMYNEGTHMSQRWHIGYTMTIDRHPSIPGKPMASDLDIEKFILEVMYMPILRCYRPIGGLTNLV